MQKETGGMNVYVRELAKRAVEIAIEQGKRQHWRLWMRKGWAFEGGAGPRRALCIRAE
jgi:hypothetical protein